MTGKESGDDMETIIETLRPVFNTITWSNLLHSLRWIKISYPRIILAIRKIEHVANQFEEIILRMWSLMLTIEYHGRIPVILGVGNQSVAMEYFTQQTQKKNSTMVMFHLKERSQLEQFHMKAHRRTWDVVQNVLFGHLTT